MKPSIATGMRPPSYGSGLGVSQNNFWKERSVASGNYGIYPEKGQWDDELDDDETIEKLDQKVVSKSPSVFYLLPNDTKAKSGNRKDHKTSGHLGIHNLVSHSKKSGDLLREFIKESLKEASISGRAYVRKSLGDPYKVDKTTVGSGIGRAKVSPKLRSVQIPNTTASGVTDMNYLNTEEEDFDEFDLDNSSFDLFILFDPDEENLKKHNKANFC